MERTNMTNKTFKEEVIEHFEKNQEIIFTPLEDQNCDYRDIRLYQEALYKLFESSLDLYKQKILEAYTAGFSDLVHPEFCKQSGEQFKECAKCRSDEVKHIIESI